MHCAEAYFSAPCPEVIKLFSCSAELSLKFSLLINMEMPTIVAMFCKKEFVIVCDLRVKEFAIVSNLRFICGTNFMFSRVEPEKSLITPGPYLP